jgi:hypothetical protein
LATRVRNAALNPKRDWYTVMPSAFPEHETIAQAVRRQLAAAADETGDGR